MLSESGGLGPYINGDVPDSAADHPDEFSLIRIRLVVQPAKHAGSGPGVIILNKPAGKAQILEPAFLKPLDKEPARVAMDLQLDEQQTFNADRTHFHHCLLCCAIWSGD